MVVIMLWVLWEVVVMAGIVLVMVMVGVIFVVVVMAVLVVGMVVVFLGGGWSGVRLRVEIWGGVGGVEVLVGFLKRFFLF